MRSMPILWSYQYLTAYYSARQAARGASRVLRGYDGRLKKFLFTFVAFRLS